MIHYQVVAKAVLPAIITGDIINFTISFALNEVLKVHHSGSTYEWIMYKKDSSSIEKHQFKPTGQFYKSNSLQLV